ncbi:LysR family transcriptional regulator [Martelella mediterranea]|uniref:Quorum-sensing regulator protein D n=1 Tax=Martelella mediterranea DSM 17316 TaxID=1122214 RepID=A0A1U9Z7E3_9HYPH|nr:LysR family transcriptional regulator [Martelella mediterranea]AQZ53598.1 Quorum-sensing regulator protein D [Martelella mediterranea DSM 17316]
MRLEWLEDILAVVETGSFNAAAARRNVTQPAFSRRIRAIEDYVGAELFDRDRKPVGLKPSISAQQEEIKRLVSEMKDLLYELRRQGREANNRIVIASQHAITTSRAPGIIEAFSNTIDVSVRLRSANRDECLALLMTKQADLLLNYQSVAEAAAETEDYLERVNLGTEAFIPVFATHGLGVLNDSYARGELPVIAYPSDAFLGRIFNEEVMPQVPSGEFVRRKVETALTLAALQFAISGVGVAWVPESIARDAIRAGLLFDLRDVLPHTLLTVAAVRLAGGHTAVQDLIWTEINAFGKAPAEPEHFR